MRETVLQKLKEIEEREDVRILYCVESGSRAWGFASPDSDYDVRFVYVRPRDYYLRLDATRDVIEWQLDDTFDVNGWDLQKLLRLLHKSNPTVFEWHASPIVYKTTEEWQKVAEIIPAYFSKASSLRHYFSIAKNNYREYLKGETVKLKKYFYALRPLLACRWILAEATPPPMPFRDLLSGCADDAVRSDIEILLAKKEKTSELGEGKRMDVINAYLDRTIVEIESALTDYPATPPLPWQYLNEAFLKLI